MSLEPSRQPSQSPSASELLEEVQAEQDARIKRVIDLVALVVIIGILLYLYFRLTNAQAAIDAARLANALNDTITPGVLG